MRTSARVRANRANAQRSTGPRSKEGKARSALNSFKHGLSIPAAMLPQLSSEIEAYVGLLVGVDASDELKSAAITFAEAQLDVDRVRKARLALYEDEQARLRQPTSREMSRSLMRQLKYLDSLYVIDEQTGEPIFADVTQTEVIERYEALSCEPKPVSLELGMGVLVPKLARLWRYERRALSRRDAVAKRFEELSATDETSAPEDALSYTRSNEA